MNKQRQKQLIIFKLYLKAILLSCAVIIPIGLYIGISRGHFNLRDFTNTVALSSFSLLGIVLLLGPLARIFNIFDKFLQYRKELGIITFFLGFLHAFNALFLIGRFGPLGLFLGAPLSAYTGLLALLILIGLFTITLQTIKKPIPYKVWWRLQYWGVRSAALLVLVHMLVLKTSSWLSWYQGHYVTNLAFPKVPPPNLLVTIFIGFVIMVRLSEFIKDRFEKIFVTVYFMAMVGVYLWLFIHPFI